MPLEEFDALLAQHRVVVFVTYRRDGRPQMSLVTAGRVGDALGFTTRRQNAKYHNLMRDSRCAMMLVRPGWRGYAVLDGDATVITPQNSSSEELRVTLQEVYRAAAGVEHPDWDDYDRAMIEQGRVAVLLRPSRTYAQNLS